MLFSSTQPVWSHRGLSASTNEAQDLCWQSKCAYSSATCFTILCYSLSHIHTHTKCSHRHTFRELSLTSTHLHPDKQAKSTPSHYLCGEQFCSYWCEQCGAVFRSSSAAAAATAGRVQRRAIITRDHTAASTIEGKPPFPLTSFSLFLSLLFSLSLHDAVLLTFPYSPPLLLLLSVCQWDNHGGHPQLQPCHLLPGVRTPGTAHASQ